MPGWELIGREEREAVGEVFDGGGILWAHGFDDRRATYKVRQFERDFAARMQAPRAAAVSSGTAALKVALDALEVGPGDEVVTQCLGFVGTVEAIVATGADPVFTEIDDTLCMDPAALAGCLSPRTKVVLPVHMLGGVAAIDQILSIAQKHGAAVLEDVAQALGATFSGRPAGTLGDVAAFSFDFAKTLTTGEGGMVLTSDDALADRCRAAHDHGHDYRANRPRYDDTFSSPGFNFRMTELQAAVGIAQLGKLDAILDAQRANWHELVSRLPNGVCLRRLPDDATENHDTVAIILDSASEANAMLERLARESIWPWIVPASMTWHFASAWTHLVPAMAVDSFAASRALLERTITFHVPVRRDEDFLRRWSRAWR